MKQARAFLLFATLILILSIVLFISMTANYPDYFMAVAGVLTGSLLGILTSEIIGDIFLED